MRTNAQTAGSRQASALVLAGQADQTASLLSHTHWTEFFLRICLKTKS